MTRFEKIKKLTIDELAEYLNEHVDCGMCHGLYTVKDWLESEVDDEE